MRRIVGGLLAAAVGVLAAAPASAATVRRDPAVQPFSVASVWNTPIGREARYVPAALSASAVGVEPVTVAAASPADPVVPVLSADCASTGRSLRMPSSPPPPTRTLAVVAPDRVTVDAWASPRRCGGSVGGRYLGRLRLDGDGVPAGGSVAGLPGVGGALTVREARDAVPVRHALAVLVPARLLASGPAWPAVRSDGTRATPRSGGALRLGALLALPPADVPPVTTPTGRRLVAALRDYGAYVAGVTTGDAVRLRTVRPAVLPSPVRDELRPVVAALAVVADNTPASVGGPGERRAPLAAPLAAPPRTAPAPTPTASARLPRAPAGALPVTPAAQIVPRGDAGAPPLAVAVIAAVALALLALGLRTGRAFTRPPPPR